MKTETYLNIGIVAALLFAVYLIVRQGRGWLDDVIGDDPGGIVGGDDFSDPANYPGWLTRWHSFFSGNPNAGVMGVPRGSVFDWDPLGLLGQGSQGGFLW